MQKQAIDDLWIEYTEYYSYKNGLRYSNIDTIELEKLSFDDYKKWYDNLLIKKNLRAISPATALKFLREEINNFEVEPGDVE